MANICLDGSEDFLQCSRGFESASWHGIANGVACIGARELADSLIGSREKEH